ncbi:SAM-dependent methyltransferase [Psychroserpens sp.]|uniref:SAM-dependent methyltransferase n=1 Tax=Psychroserpens sp. TaxID=2020870 RepID=UPI003859550B
MTERAIQNIYNKLLNWEGKNASQPYPIHKKLNADDFGYADIYEWIANTYKLDANKNVLDAGCGVGYGSLYLAKHYNCEVTGISLSDAEVEKANIFAKNEPSLNKVNFKLQSFDNLEPNCYDFIMAIESVKHTLNIDKTIHSLKNALKPEGILIIVDDFLVHENHNALIIKYSKDWALKVILKRNQFSSDFIIKKDLTSFVLTKNQLSLSLGILILTLLKPLIKVASIMRGGLYLEKLFKHNSMKYYVLEFKKSKV